MTKSDSPIVCENQGYQALIFYFRAWKQSMQISDEKVGQYMELYLKKYGKPIDKVRARDELTSLVCLLEAVYKHINQKNYGK